MSESRDLESVNPPYPPGLPSDLPPVEPPSGAFIAQLFLVPAVIVLLIVGAWLALNRLVSADQDWHVLVNDLQSPHQHLRWRGAFGLAQMLQADQAAPPGEVKLVNNAEVATHLAKLLQDELKRGSAIEDDLKQQAFLARTLGLFHIADAVLPALEFAIEPQHDREIRKNALGAVAVIAGRQAESGQPLQRPELQERLLSVSTEPDPLLRQMAAFDLGLLPGPRSVERLVVLLEDADASTRVNAAIGLARQKSAAGLPVLMQVLKSADEQVAAGSDEEYQKFLSLKNVVHALDLIGPELQSGQRTEAISLLEPVADHYREPRIRIDAESVLLTLKSRT